MIRVLDLIVNFVMNLSMYLSLFFSLIGAVKWGWHLTKLSDGILLGDVGATSAFSMIIDKQVTSLLLGSLKEYHVGKILITASTFLNYFA